LSEGHGTIDQYLAGDPGCLPSVLRASAAQSSSLRQEFVPDDTQGTNLQHIALCLTMSSTSNLLVTVRAGTAAAPGAVLGTAGANGVLGGTRWAEFEFTTAIPITDGTTYVIEVGGFPAFSWRGTCAAIQGTCTSVDPDLYPAGVANAPAPIGDLAFRTYGSFDQDSDGIGDPVDNCISVANPGQENTDANFIDQTPPKSVDDTTYVNSDALGDACDDDDDNDALLDVEEEALPGAPCPSATAPTDPSLRDTDGDRYIDDAECTLGTNPNDAGSKPSAAACGPTTDADGDGINARIEFCHYKTNPGNADTDGDGCADGKEIASVNADFSVNSIDLGLLASEFGASPPRFWNMDINKDGQVNSIDLGIQAGRFGPC
jgi:hypothetical protein